MFRRFCRPCSPARQAACDVFKLNAINGADWNAQLTARAMWLDDGVHQLVAADDGVCGAGFYAQRAANAPVFINKSDAARAFDAVFRVEWLNSLTRYFAQSLNALSATRGALVDSRVIMNDGVGVGLAVGKPAAGALGLGQGSENLSSFTDFFTDFRLVFHVSGHRAYFLGAATHVVLTLPCDFSEIKGFDTTLGAGFATALADFTGALGATLVTVLTVV